MLEPTLLLNHTGHVENRPPRRDTAGCDGQGIFRALPAGLFIQEDAVARANQLGGIPDLVINVSGLEFTVRVGIERTVLRYGLAPEPGRGLLVSRHGIQQIIAGRPGLHPVQDGQALPQQLGGGLDIASKNDFPLNRKVVDLGGDQIGHVLEEGRGLGGATFIVRGGEEPGGVQIDPPLPHGGDKDRIQVDLPREADGGPGCPFPSFLDADRVKKDGHGLTLPGCHTHHQGELGATAYTLFCRLVVEYPLQTSMGGAKHPPVSEEGIQVHLPAGEQLGDSRGMGMGQIHLCSQLPNVLQGGDPGLVLVVLPPRPDAVQGRHAGLFPFRFVGGPVSIFLAHSRTSLLLGHLVTVHYLFAHS